MSDDRGAAALAERIGREKNAGGVPTIWRAIYFEYAQRLIGEQGRFLPDGWPSEGVVGVLDQEVRRLREALDTVSGYVLTASWPTGSPMEQHRQEAITALDAALSPEADHAAWAERVIDRWAPDTTSRVVEAEARALAGASHVHGAIPARFWREAIEKRLASPEAET